MKKKINYTTLKNISVYAVPIVAILLWIIAIIIWKILSITKYTFWLGTFIISLIWMYSYFEIFKKCEKNQIWKEIAIIGSLIASSLIAILSIQASVPIFAPIVDISIGDIKHGFVQNNYTSVRREFKIDIKPPLLLTKLNFNCQEYDIAFVKRERLNAPIGPLQIESINKAQEFPGFYKTIKICLDSNKKIDAFKLGTLSTSAYLETIQPIYVHINQKTSKTGDDNTNYITRRLTKRKDNLLTTEITIINLENYPITLWTNLKMKNDSQAYKSLKELVNSETCKKNIVAYSIADYNNLTKIREVHNIHREQILGNYSINFGLITGILNIDHVEPYEKKSYYFAFECEK